LQSRRARTRGVYAGSCDWPEFDRWASLSPGERKRWQIAAALADDPEVLLLDEPTNHLDWNAREWLVRALREFAGLALVVSHDRERITFVAQELSAGDVQEKPRDAAAAAS
jgi:ATPase subunit of ABC transporter with duplicated ATPase domains